MLSSDLLGEVNKSHGLRHDRADAGPGGTVWGWGSVHARWRAQSQHRKGRGRSRGCRGGQSSPGGDEKGQTNTTPMDADAAREHALLCPPALADRTRRGISEVGSNKLRNQSSSPLLAEAN